MNKNLACLLTGLMMVLMLLIQQACNNESDYTDEQFTTIIDRELALLEYAKKAKESHGKKKKQYLIKYFKAFPSDFETYFKIHHNTCYGDTLYSIKDTYGYGFSRNPWGRFYPVEKIVDSIEEVPKEAPSERFKWVDLNKYYESIFKDNEYFTDYDRNIIYEVKKVMPAKIFCKKMVAVGIGGFSDAEDYFYRLAGIDDTELLVKVLEERSDDEIASYFYFGYDGPHPRNYYDTYKWEYEEIKKLSPRVAELMKKAYERLLSDQHCPGH